MISVMEQSYRVEEGTGGCPWVGASEGEALAAAWTSLEEACFQGASLQIGKKNINDGFDKYMYHNYFMDIIGGVIPGGICTKQTEKCNINDWYEKYRNYFMVIFGGMFPGDILKVCRQTRFIHASLIHKLTLKLNYRKFKGILFYNHNSITNPIW